MANKYFERGGRGVFKCATCGRSTRQTTQPTGSELCGECDELAMLENSVQDGASVQEIAPYRDEAVKAICARGGDMGKIRENFDILWIGRSA